MIRNFLFSWLVILMAVLGYSWFVDSQPPEQARIENFIRSCREYFQLSDGDCQQFLKQWGQFMENKPQDSP